MQDCVFVGKKFSCGIHAPNRSGKTARGDDNLQHPSPAWPSATTHGAGPLQIFIGFTHFSDASTACASM